MRFTFLILAFAIGGAQADAQDKPTISAEALAAIRDAARAETETQRPPPAEEANEVEEVVVTGRRPVETVARRVPLTPDPFTFFAEFCFESNRLNRRSARPVGDPTWKPLDRSMRQQLKISDSSTVSYGRFDARLGPALILRIDQHRLPKGLTEHRCSLTILGAASQPKFVDKMSSLFNGLGTQAHVGHDDAPGYKPLPGWHQWLWSAIPKKGSKDWHVSGTRRNERRSFVRIKDAGLFYSQMSYVAGDLRYNEDVARSITVLTLTHTFKP